MSAMQSLLLQIAVILLLSRLLGLLMRLIHQPQVVGEMIAGIILGPSVLGLIHHQRWMHTLFPTALMGNLEILSQLGVMLFMFLVGLELDPKLLRGQAKAALVTGTVGIVIPFTSGATLAYVLYQLAPALTGAVPSIVVLCAFMGAAMSITAFPVLARILTERNLQKTKSGTLAITCAAMDDVMGWCILAFVLALAQINGIGNAASSHGGTLHAALKTIFLAIGYVLVMIFVVRRLLGGLQAHFESRGYLSQDVLAIIFLLLVGSSAATDAIGIHQIFGAFLLGAVMPNDGTFVKYLVDRIEDVTVLFFLPLFFAYTGLRTELGLLTSPGLWIVCGIIVLTATAGKFGGVCLAARWYGMKWRQSALLGILMNTRGLMELIILNIGLTMGVLSKTLFAMMVVMALATTFMTTPFMRLLYSRQRQQKELEEAQRDQAQRVDGLHVVVPVSLASTAPSLIRMGGMLMAGSPGRLYALHLIRPDALESPALSNWNQADHVLEVAQKAALADRLPINAVSFVSQKVGRDISEAVERYRASWVVIGWHKPVFFKSLLGGVVGQVLRQAPANIAVFIDKGLVEAKQILVPYLGGPQDKGALLAARRLARIPGVKLTILHIVRPNRTGSDSRLGIQTLIDMELPEGAGNSVRMQVIESDNAVGAVVEESKNHDLVILGLADEWNLHRGKLFGRQETVAQRVKCSVLIAHASLQAPVVQTEPEAAEQAAGAQ
jgi:Kef-type K+ transport system membrane component KefB/nucleotide-binding universal stress UspA family protein